MRLSSSIEGNFIVRHGVARRARAPIRRCRVFEGKSVRRFARLRFHREFSQRRGRGGGTLAPTPEALTRSYGLDGALFEDAHLAVTYVHAVTNM